MQSTTVIQVWTITFFYPTIYFNKPEKVSSHDNKPSYILMFKPKQYRNISTGKSLKLLIKLLFQIVICLLSVTQTHGFMKCQGNPNAKKLKYLSGDAMTDSKTCLGPHGEKYPHKEIERQISGINRQGRSGKSLFSEQTGE